MSAMTDVFERGISKLILNGDMWAPTGAPTGNLVWNDAGALVTAANSKIFIRLYSVDPTDTMGTGTAVSVAGGYDHKPVAFEALTTETDGQVTTTAAVTWTATADWNTTVDGFSLHLADSATDVADGNAMFHGGFSGNAVTVQTGDTVNIATGALTITFA